MTIPDTSFDAEGFSGHARLFPLPNLVMFPHVVQPLHIFEPRYREMLQDALADDQLLAMSLLAPGWEAVYDGRPPVESVVCLGRVLSHTRLEDGSSNLLLLGQHRAEIVRELPPQRSFREADVQLLCDDYESLSDASSQALRRDMLQYFRRLLPAGQAAQEHYEQLRGNDVPLGMLTDVVSFTLQLSLAEKQTLLAESNVQQRAALLLEHLDSILKSRHEGGRERPYPPRFSDN